MFGTILSGTERISMSERARYKVIYDTLKGEILSGSYASARAFPSSIALSRRFKTTRATIRRALDQLRNIGLIGCRKGSGTFVTKIGSARKIGLIIPGVAYSEVFPPIVSEISKLAQEGGFKLFIGDVPCQSVKMWTRRAKQVAQDLVKDKVSGVIFQPIETVIDAEKSNLEVLSVFRKFSIPVVLVGYDICRRPFRSEYDVIGINNFDAGSCVADYLSSLGARRIHYVMGKEDESVCGYNRIRGVAVALGSKRFSLQKNVLQTDPDDLDTIRKYVSQNSPDAFICGNDIIATSFRQSLEKIGLKVPQDMLLTGFDDVNVARVAGLTTVRQPCLGIARAAYRRLLERIEDPTLEPTEIFLSAPVIERASTMVGREQAGRFFKCKGKDVTQ